MAQPLISEFYNKRKRPAEGYPADFKSKVLVLDADNKVASADHSSCSLAMDNSDEFRKVPNAIQNQECTKLISGKPLAGKNEMQSHSRDVNKSSVLKKGKRVLNKSAKCKTTNQTSKTDIRLAFKTSLFNNVSNASVKSSSTLDTKNESIKTVNDGNSNPPSADNRVVFELLGGLSPRKKEICTHESPVQGNRNNEKDVEIKNARKELGLSTPKKTIEQNSQAMSLNDIRNKLNKSSRLAELRESILRFNKGEQELKELEIQKRKLETTSPRLRKFSSIDLEVPVSPKKSPSVSACPSILNKMSPKKSPLKSPLKTYAYQRLAHLSQPGIPTLTLPYTYRLLAEIFRCMDTVMSMIYNRRETVTYEKLKAGVQQMLRRNFTEVHLGQIKKVLPNAFRFSREKCTGFLPSQKNKYELVIVPVVDFQAAEVSRTTNGSFHSIMTPSLLLVRRESFHRNLLEIVKDHHEIFLETLNPPVHISRAKLARWHPDFDLEHVPAVTPEELPAAPTDEKLCTAKDVLERAKTLFGCNQRMEKALLMVSEKMSKSEQPSPSQVTSTSNSSLLKGIPKALLEKVRAKQAAKALLAMTRTPAEDHQATQLGRLPEISRILRSIFVAEKKSVLALEVVLNKLSNSYRESLSAVELERHIHLLKKVVPGWVEILNVRKTDYVKLSKDADMSAVIKKLEKLVAENNAVI